MHLKPALIYLTCISDFWW